MSSSFYIDNTNKNNLVSKKNNNYSKKNLSLEKSIKKQRFERKMIERNNLFENKNPIIVKKKKINKNSSLEKSLLKKKIMSMEKRINKKNSSLEKYFSKKKSHLSLVKKSINRENLIKNSEHKKMERDFSFSKEKKKKKKNI